MTVGHMFKLKKFKDNQLSQKALKGFWFWHLHKIKNVIYYEQLCQDIYWLEVLAF